MQKNPIYATRYIIADIDPLLADTHAFEELRLLSQLRSRPTTLNEYEMASLRRIIGGIGHRCRQQAGVAARRALRGPRAAFAAAQRWRRRADHPLNDPFTTRACRAAVRSAEALVAEYAARGIRRGAASTTRAAERPQQPEPLIRRQPRGVVGLVRTDSARAARLHRPGGDAALGARQPPRRQRLCDQNELTRSSSSVPNSTRSLTVPSPAGDASVWCGASGHGGSWSQCPHSATVIAPPGARVPAGMDDHDGVVGVGGTGHVRAPAVKP